LWDECVVIYDISLCGPAKDVAANPPKIVLQVYDYDPGVRTRSIVLGSKAPSILGGHRSFSSTFDAHCRAVPTRALLRGVPSVDQADRTNGIELTVENYNSVARTSDA
jgi:hypothetical protein